MRRNFWDLVADPADDALRWYARAVDAMLPRPLADPLSWRYQAAIHEYDRQTDPLAKDGEPNGARRANPVSPTSST